MSKQMCLVFHGSYFLVILLFVSAKGYGLFKKDRLFPQPGCSRKLPSKPKPKKVKKKNTNQNQDSENTNSVDCNNEEHGIKTSKEAREPLGILRLRVEKIHEEAHIENTYFETQSHKEIVPSDQSWSKRRENVDAGWDANRDTYLKAFIRNLALSKSEICSSCHISITNLAVRCNTCRNILCPECDWVFHSKRPFHYRELFEKLSSRPLLPSECVNSAGPVEEKAVPVPLTVPSHCANCEHKGTIELTAGSTCFFRKTKIISIAPPVLQMRMKIS
ncbi:hypothetical protein OUZ56_010562 [Daphnia magna]|uniref:B box-type domain-containing protein n=1 Tax=Daphnia magna TaxID=35525 RepID=A0ABR0AIV8_9CRUS|nr:hypothetical protein OUZ56_010562 [Daphnia magna]